MACPEAARRIVLSMEGTGDSCYQQVLERIVSLVKQRLEAEGACVMQPGSVSDAPGELSLRIRFGSHGTWAVFTLYHWLRWNPDKALAELLADAVSAAGRIPSLGARAGMGAGPAAVEICIGRPDHAHEAFTLGPDFAERVAAGIHSGLRQFLANGRDEPPDWPSPVPQSPMPLATNPGAESFDSEPRMVLFADPAVVVELPEEATSGVDAPDRPTSEPTLPEPTQLPARVGPWQRREGRPIRARLVTRVGLWHAAEGTIVFQRAQQVQASGQLREAQPVDASMQYFQSATPLSPVERPAAEPPSKSGTGREERSAEPASSVRRPSARVVQQIGSVIRVQTDRRT